MDSSEQSPSPAKKGGKATPEPTETTGGRYGDLRVEEFKLKEAQKKVAANERLAETRRLDVEERLDEIQELDDDIARREDDMLDQSLTEEERGDCERALAATRSDKKRAQLLLKVAQDRWKHAAECEDVALNAVDRRALAGKEAQGVIRQQQGQRQEEYQELAGQKKRSRQIEYSSALGAWNHRVYEERMRRRQEREEELQRQPTWVRNQKSGGNGRGGSAIVSGGGGRGFQHNKPKTTVANLTEARPAFGETRSPPEVGQRKAAMRDFSSRLPSPMTTQMAGFGDGTLRVNEVSDLIRSPKPREGGAKNLITLSSPKSATTTAGGGFDGGDHSVSGSMQGAFEDDIGVSTIVLDATEMQSLSQTIQRGGGDGILDETTYLMSEGADDDSHDEGTDLFEYTLRLNKAAVLHMSALRHTRAKKCLDEADRLTTPQYLSHLVELRSQQQEEYEMSMNSKTRDSHLNARGGGGGGALAVTFNPEAPVPKFPGPEVDLDDPMQAPLGFPSYRIALEVRATTFNNRGCLFKVANHVVDALVALEVCMACEERLGVLSGRTLLNLANILTLGGRHEDAMLASRRAMQLLRGANNQAMESRAKNREQAAAAAVAQHSTSTLAPSQLHNDAGDPDLETTAGAGVQPVGEQQSVGDGSYFKGHILPAEDDEVQYNLQGVALETLVLTHARQKKSERSRQRRGLPSLN